MQINLKPNYLNTSYVIVYQRFFKFRLAKNTLFKYILCYCLSKITGQAMNR